MSTSTVDSRLKEIANKSLCYNCLGSHAVRVCTSNYNCYNCGARHNSCICRQTDAAKNNKKSENTFKSNSNPSSPNRKRI